MNCTMFTVKNGKLLFYVKGLSIYNRWDAKFWKYEILNKIWYVDICLHYVKAVSATNQLSTKNKTTAYEVQCHDSRCTIFFCAPCLQALVSKHTILFETVGQQFKGERNELDSGTSVELVLKFHPVQIKRKHTVYCLVEDCVVTN